MIFAIKMNVLSQSCRKSGEIKLLVFMISWKKDSYDMMSNYISRFVGSDSMCMQIIFCHPGIFILKLFNNNNHNTDPFFK